MFFYLRVETSVNFQESAVVVEDVSSWQGETAIHVAGAGQSVVSPKPLLPLLRGWRGTEKTRERRVRSRSGLKLFVLQRVLTRGFSFPVDTSARMGMILERVPTKLMLVERRSIWMWSGAVPQFTLVPTLVRGVSLQRSCELCAVTESNLWE